MDKTLYFFKQINKIPRPSGHEEKIKKYLIDFAKAHNLEYKTDKTKNVLIKKQTNTPNCNKTLILQAHTDMVCEKNLDTKINFLKDPIKTKTQGDFLMAKGTTLGADNGIGLSMILSILDDEKLKIPNLECVFTTQEETTMLGAINFDATQLKGKHLLSIDGTDEAKIESSSAGMVVCEYKKTFKQQKINDKENIFNISICGFRGGHSGTEISTDRKNCIKAMIDVLKSIKQDFRISSLVGGGKSNAIARECECTIVAQNLTKFELNNLINNIIQNYTKSEKDAYFVVEEVKTFNKNNQIACLNFDDTKNIINFLDKIKHGVLDWSREIDLFPIASQNLANINLQNGQAHIVVSTRSSVVSLEEKYVENLFYLANEFGYKVEVTSKAPFFEKNPNSYLQPLCKNTYEKLYKKPCLVGGVHAGLEGGVFAKKIPDIDICVIAPNIYDCHSPMERVSLASVKRVYRWVERIVKNF